MKMEEICKVMNSQKRVRILYEVGGSVFIGYKKLSERTGISSYEMYKHLWVLEKAGLVANVESKWVITYMGRKVILLLKKMEKVNGGGESGGNSGGIQPEDAGDKG